MDQNRLIEMPMTDVIMLLERIKALNDNAIREVEEFMCHGNLSTLAREYDANLKKRDVDIGFNLFAIISERYHQENLHSDVLKALLDPMGKHQEQEKFLHLFLEFIRSQGAKINLGDYKNAQVVREEGRIDILIKDEVSKRAIIVENKINNAGDMPKQLLRYLGYVMENGYACDAIVYLRLNGEADPDMTGWKPDDQKRVKAILKVICAYDETEKDLLNGWIEPCAEESKKSKNPDVHHIFRQYGDLIKKLGGNIMNKPVMQKFYEIIVKDENLKTALSLKAMLDELIIYRADRIVEKYKDDPAPFDKVFYYDEGALFQRSQIPNLTMAVWPGLEDYLFTFHDRNDPEGTRGQTKATLQKMGCLGDYAFKGGQFHMVKKFAFPSQEEDLIRHLTDFKRKLGEVLLSV